MIKYHYKHINFIFGGRVVEKIDKEALVFIIHQFQVGGVESAFINLVKKIDSKKIYLVIAYESIDNEFISKIPNHVEIIKINGKKGSFLSLCLKILKIKLSFSFKDAHVINYSDTLSTLFVQRFLNSRITSTWIHCNPLALVNSKSFKIYKYLINKNNNIVCLCDTQKKLLSKLIPSSSNKIQVIGNNIDNELINILATQKLSFKYKYIIMVSRFDCRTKDFGTLIDAYSLLPEYIRREFKLVLLGDGPDRQMIEQYVTSLHLEEHVFFPGKDINPFKWMKNATVMAHSSLSEGFSLVLLEAMSLGKTVISSDCNCGPGDILDFGKYGFLFPIGDVCALNKILTNLLAHHDLLEKYDRLSLERANVLQSNSISKIKGFFGG